MPAAPTTIPRMGRKRKQLDERRYEHRLAIRVREVRLERDKTVPQVAKAIKIPASTYYAYENGSLTFPFEVLASLAKYFKVTMHHLIPEE